MIQQWVGGKIKIVLPEAVKEADFVYPKPAW
jgi:branched-chain amino acid transport system substrate-binding protein